MDFALWAEAAQIMWDSHRPKYVAVDTETEGVAFWDRPFCVTVAWRYDGYHYSHYLELGQDGVNDVVKHIIANSEYLVFHNAKFDLQKLILAGLMAAEGRSPHSVHDTEALAHLLDEHRVKRLKVLAREILGETTDEEEVIRAARRKEKLRKEDGYHRLPREVIVPYALKDAEFTIRLFEELYPQLTKVDDLSRLYAMEQELTFVLLGMESAGMALDVEYVETTAREYNNQALKQELLIRDMTGDEEFNPNSPKQITEAFERMGLCLEATDKATLKSVEHPLAQAILELRTLRKMHGTYLKPMLSEQRDGIIHPSFRQHGTRTGRMSSGSNAGD